MNVRHVDPHLTSFVTILNRCQSDVPGVSYVVLTGATCSFRRDVSQTTSISLDVSPHDVDMSSHPKDVKYQKDVNGSSDVDTSSRPKDVKYQMDVAGSSEPTRLDVPGE